MTNCKQCGIYINPIEAMISKKHGVCGNCSRENHKKVVGGN